MIRIDFVEVEKEFRENSIQLIKICDDCQDNKNCKKICRKSFCEFIFPISGRAITKINDKFITCEKGDLIHCCQNKIIDFEVIGEETFNTIKVNYIIPEDGENLKYMNSVFMMKINNYDSMLNLLKNIQDVSSNSEILSSFKLQLHSNLFIKELFKKEENKEIKNDKEMVLGIIDYMSKNYAENITLKSLSEKFNCKSERISYMFHKDLKVRPIEYLIQYRMTLAYKLLEEGSSVKSVAYSIGYNDEFYFSRLFKKNFGVSPNKIKNSI